MPNDVPNMRSDHAATGPAAKPPPARPPSDFTRFDAALLLLVLIWGVNFAAIKTALLEINVTAFAILRFTLATGVIMALVVIRGEPLGIPRRHWPAVIGLGLVGHTLYQLLFTYGLEMTTSGRSALMLALVPVFVAIIGTLVGFDRLSAQRWAGVGLSFVGIVLVTLGRSTGGSAGLAPLTGGTVAGDLLVLSAALGWALYTVFGSAMLEEHSPLKLTGVTMAVGTIGLAIVGWPGLVAQDWASVGLQTWGLYTYATLAGLVVAYTIWYTGVRHLGGTRTAVYSNLVPVVALIFGWLAMGERLGTLQIVGALVALFGVWITRRKR